MIDERLHSQKPELKSRGAASIYSALSSRPLWLRALLLAGVVLALTLLGARLGRGLGQPIAVAIEAPAPAQTAAVPAPTPAALRPTAAAAPPQPGGIAATPAPAEWPVLLAERFDRASAGWPELLRPSWHSRYHDGGYELALDSRPSFSYSAPLPARDFRLSADVRIGQGQAGLFFLLGRPNDFYRFLIDRQGRYRLEWQQVGHAVPLLDWAASAALRQGDTTNQLAAQRDGDRVTLYANGVQLATYALPPGTTLEPRVGLALDAPEGQLAARAWFDNLVVRAPAP